MAKKEYGKSDIKKIMAQPYSRIIVMHLTVLIGFFGFLVLGLPLIFLFIIILLKTYLDFRAHNKEHQTIFNLSRSSCE